MYWSYLSVLWSFGHTRLTVLSATLQVTSLYWDGEHTQKTTRKKFKDRAQHLWQSFGQSAPELRLIYSKREVEREEEEEKSEKCVIHAQPHRRYFKIIWEALAEKLTEWILCLGLPVPLVCPCGCMLGLSSQIHICSILADTGDSIFIPVQIHMDSPCLLFGQSGLPR